MRLTVSRRLYVDDGWAFTGIVLLLGLSICLTIAIPSMYELLNVISGVKKPGPTFYSDASYYLKAQFAQTILFWSCLWAVKGCFLAFFCRLTKGLKYCTWAWYATAVITFLTYVASVITYPISCSSFILGGLVASSIRIVRLLTILIGQCDSELHVYRILVSLRFSVAVDLITDAMIIALPLYLALRVQLPLADKLALAGIFSLGGVIMMFAIIRIAVTNQHNTHPETSWLNLWSQIEASVAVIISSLAPFKALFASRKTSSYRQSDSTGKRRGAYDISATDKPTGPVHIPLDQRNHAFAERGTISFENGVDSDEKLLNTPHILKTLEVEQHRH